MTDTETTTAPNKHDVDVQRVLSAHRWMTAQEVWIAQARLPVAAVRRILQYLAEASVIEGRIGGSGLRPVREYRAWK